MNHRLKQLLHITTLALLTLTVPFFISAQEPRSCPTLETSKSGKSLIVGNGYWIYRDKDLKGIGIKVKDIDESIHKLRLSPEKPTAYIKVNAILGEEKTHRVLDAILLKEGALIILSYGWNQKDKNIIGKSIIVSKDKKITCTPLSGDELEIIKSAVGDDFLKNTTTVKVVTGEAIASKLHLQ